MLQGSSLIAGFFLQYWTRKFYVTVIRAINFGILRSWWREITKIGGKGLEKGESFGEPAFFIFYVQGYVQYRDTIKEAEEIFKYRLVYQ